MAEETAPCCLYCGTGDPRVMRTSPFAEFCGEGCSRMYYEARRHA